MFAVVILVSLVPFKASEHLLVKHIVSVDDQISRIGALEIAVLAHLVEVVSVIEEYLARPVLTEVELHIHVFFIVIGLHHRIVYRCIGDIDNANDIVVLVPELARSVQHTLEPYPCFAFLLNGNGRSLSAVVDVIYFHDILGLVLTCPQLVVIIAHKVTADEYRYDRTEKYYFSHTLENAVALFGEKPSQLLCEGLLFLLLFLM